MRQPPRVLVHLYPTLAAFEAGEVGAELIKSSPHKALHQASHALGDVKPRDAPDGRWVAARCFVEDGSWEKLLFTGEK